MADPVVIGINQNKFVKDANTKALTLYSTNFSTGAESLHAQGVAYVVPAGKKFVALSITWINYSTTRDDVTLYYGTTIDSTAGATEWLKMSIGGTTTDSSDGMTIPIYQEIPAANYFTMNAIASGNVPIVFGVECDA